MADELERVEKKEVNEEQLLDGTFFPSATRSRIRIGETIFVFPSSTSIELNGEYVSLLEEDKRTGDAVLRASQVLSKLLFQAQQALTRARVASVRNSPLEAQEWIMNAGIPIREAQEHWNHGISSEIRAILSRHVINDDPRARS